MTTLLTIKEKLAKFYAKTSAYLSHVLIFVLAFLVFFLIGQQIGTNSMLASPLICLALALVCAFLPINATVVVATFLIMVHLFGLSIEVAVIATIILIVVYLLYFRFAPKTGFLLILTPILFYLNIPYMIPIIAGLTVGISGIVPMMAGTFIYFLITFAHNYSNAITSLEADAIVQNITFIINSLLNNREMIIIIASFSVVTLVVYLLRRLSVKYNWIIAIVSGCVLDTLILMIAFSVFSISYSILWMILGHVIALAIGFVLHLFLFSVDYAATEYVQFEDNDYFYYVKAVPKVSVEGKQVKVKKINTANQDTEYVRSYVHTESYDEQDYVPDPVNPESLSDEEADALYEEYEAATRKELDE